MWKEIKNALRSLLALYLLSCFIAFVIAAGIILLPIAMIIVFGFAIKEVLSWKIKPVKAYMPVIRFNLKEFVALHKINGYSFNLKQHVKSIEDKVIHYWRKDNLTFNH